MIKIKPLPDPVINYDFESVYSPSDDTYLIIDYFKEKINSDGFDGRNISDIKQLLDLGTGTGIIAIFFQLVKAKYSNFNPEIYASDILDESIKCAKLNAKANKYENAINFIKSDLFKSFPENLKKSFDFIIFNPPYLPSSNIIIESSNKTKIDHSWDGGQKGIEIFMKFLSEVKDFIKNSSYIYYISSSRSELDELNEYIVKSGFKNEILVKKHIFFEDIILNRIRMIKY